MPLADWQNGHLAGKKLEQSASSPCNTHGGCQPREARARAEQAFRSFRFRLKQTLRLLAKETPGLEQSKPFGVTKRRASFTASMMR